MAETTREDLEQTIFQLRLEELKLMPRNTPEEVAAYEQAIAQLSQDYEGQEAIIAEELAFADSNLNAPTPEGRQAGGIYVAANPMEHLGAGLRNIAGAYGMRDALDKKEGLSKDRSEGLAAFFKSQALRNNPDSALIDSQQGEQLASWERGGGNLGDSGLTPNSRALASNPNVGGGQPAPSTQPAPSSQPAPVAPAQPSMSPMATGEEPQQLNFGPPMATTAGATPPPRPIQNLGNIGGSGTGGFPTLGDAKPTTFGQMPDNALSEEDKMLLYALQSMRR